MPRKDEAGVELSWKRQAQRVHREAQVFYFAFKHPRVPWYAKLVAACSAGYLFSPIQLIPSFIPVIGFLDDFLVLFLGAKLIQRIIPPEVLTECREMAKAAEMRRKDEIRSPAAVVAVVVIAAFWIFAAVSASLVMARYISH
jgi:uncharacterized membrane protein YkvA (DUF1232 family)